MERDCLLYEGKCKECGDCSMCDLDESKICDNCGKCIDQHDEYRVLSVKEYLEKQNKTK